MTALWFNIVVGQRMKPRSVHRAASPHTAIMARYATAGTSAHTNGPCSTSIPPPCRPGSTAGSARIRHNRICRIPCGLRRIR